MPIEVFPVEGPIVRGGDYEDARSNEDIAEYLREIYEEVRAAKGVILGEHVFRVFDATSAAEVRGETHFIVADIPESPASSAEI